MNKPRQWTVQRNSHSEATIWEGKLFIASVAAAPRDKDPYLIAAAPELLYCLYHLEQELQHAFNDVPAGVDAWMAQARTAIAKAEGRTE